MVLQVGTWVGSHCFDRVQSPNRETRGGLGPYKKLKEVFMRGMTWLLV